MTAAARMRRRVGIIGADWSLKIHGPAWRQLPDVEIVAICTAHEEIARAAAAAHGVPRAYWNVRDIVADPDVDIIDVGTRTAFRYDMVMAALAAGKHVYNALPFAIDLERAKAQQVAQQKSGRVRVVDAQFRWVPAAQHMKSLIDEGFLGEPLVSPSNCFCR